MLAYGKVFLASVCHSCINMLVEAPLPLVFYIRAQTHQTHIKELVAREPATKTAVGGQPAHIYCAWVRGSNSPYHQVAVVYNCHDNAAFFDTT